VGDAPISYPRVILTLSAEDLLTFLRLTALPAPDPEPPSPPNADHEGNAARCRGSRADALPCLVPVESRKIDSFRGEPRSRLRWVLPDPSPRKRGPINAQKAVAATRPTSRWQPWLPRFYWTRTRHGSRAPRSRDLGVDSSTTTAQPYRATDGLKPPPFGEKKKGGLPARPTAADPWVLARRDPPNKVSPHRESLGAFGLHPSSTSDALHRPRLFLKKAVGAIFFHSLASRALAERRPARIPITPCRCGACSPPPAYSRLPRVTWRPTITRPIARSGRFSPANQKPRRVTFGAALWGHRECV